MRADSCYSAGLLAGILAAGAGASPAKLLPVTPRAATAGCGKTHLLPGITKYYGLTSSGRDRSYSIHLPSDYSATHAYPVVLGLHGSPGTGLFFEADTRLSEARYSGDKIMVYPNGVGGSWAGANYSEVSVAEDLRFIADLVDEVEAGYCVDTSRVYATGISNGGGFVDTLACDGDVGGRFAAFAPASGAYYTDNDGNHGACAPARSPLPVLEIHGGADESVAYGGGAGEGGTEPAVQDWLGWWAERDGCGGGPVVTDSFDGDVHHYVWTCAGQEGVLQHWKVDDMGHCWASTELTFSAISIGQGPTHIEASQLIMDFFDQHSKP
ncbi:carbohydrate esterase family 1 protein [Xylariomycetidae sp. FL0641]|nr:carbohydrate esterase family 1 protein [Xylariomycetidae sp. FL0641]